MKYLRFAVLSMIVIAALTIGLTTRATATVHQPSVSQGDMALGSYSSSPALAIPDGASGTCNLTSGATATDTITVPDSGTINDVNVVLDISHTWVGDVEVVITSPAGTIITVVETVGNANAPGAGTGCGCSSADLTTTLDDESVGGAVEAACPPTGADYTPENALTAFDGENMVGMWTIEVRDWTQADTGTLNNWSLDFDYTPVAVAVGGINVPNTGLVLIYAWESTAAYDGPGGSRVQLAPGVDLSLPHDADGNGYDTYTVTESATVDGETWVSLFIGNENFVWVPWSAVHAASSFE